MNAGSKNFAINAIEPNAFLLVLRVHGLCSNFAKFHFAKVEHSPRTQTTSKNARGSEIRSDGNVTNIYPRQLHTSQSKRKENSCIFKLTSLHLPVYS